MVYVEIYKIIEWIEYDKFEDVEYLAKGGFGTVFKAVWKDGPISSWDYDNNQWKREGETKVALKCLHNSQDITAEFLKEVESHILVRGNREFLIRCFGITKDPKTENFIMIMQLKKGSLRQYLNNNFISLDWEEKLYDLHGIAYGLNPLKRPNAYELRESIDNLYNDIHHKKVDSVIHGQVKEADEVNKKTSLPVQLPLSSTKPKNADNHDLEYSDSLRMDFIKLDINFKEENN
ncbi:kinase-like domain-containing protein [Rhizophagus irregularis DAOM 181602=DAOM 197198]|nr:kinase-like domain-containing protein [Rhizophagus irregularis DAOM 181602=DAOM 197198]